MYRKLFASLALACLASEATALRIAEIHFDEGQPDEKPCIDEGAERGNFYGPKCTTFCSMDPYNALCDELSCIGGIDNSSCDYLCEEGKT